MNSVLDLFGKENDLPVVSNVCNVYIVQTICLSIYLLSTCPSIYKSSVLYRRISRQTDRSKDRQMERQIVKTERFINRQTGAQQIDRQTDSLYNVHITCIATMGRYRFLYQTNPEQSSYQTCPNSPDRLQLAFHVFWVLYQTWECTATHMISNKIITNKHIHCKILFKSTKMDLG